MSTKQSSEKIAHKKDGEDLTTILDQTQRADLTLLIADITNSMRNLLLQNFDATAALDRSLSTQGMTEDEKLMSTDPKSADVEEMDKQRGLKAEYEKNLSSLKMKNLKRNSLHAFDDWRDQVLMRIGEVVNSRDTAKRQLENTKETASKPEAPNTIGKITETPERGTLKFKDLYPPTKNPLTKLSMEQRTLVLHSVLLLLLSLKHYNAPSRVLLLLLTSSLKLPLKTFEQDEYATAKGLLEGVKEMTAEDEKKKKVEEGKDSRKWKVGLATVAGAALIGVTGGLAAPLVAAGVGSVMGGLGLGATSAAAYLGSVAGSTYLVGGLFGAYGGRMTGNMMDNYAKEVEDFEFLPVHSNKKTSENEEEAVKQASDHDHKLRVTICISGWLTEKEEILKPWRVLGTGAEVFALKYELEAMLNLGNAMNGFVQSAAWGYAKKKVIAASIFADLSAALWPIGLLKAARIVDNPFNVAKARSEKAGEVLADALINKAQGERPVTLIGYSLGARVIYTCLMSLAKRKAFGLVENAVLVGAPTPSDTSDWRMLRSVVSGRLINVYSENDYVLGFMYRTSSLQYGVAGLQAVQGLSGVENVDVSTEISGHLRYRYLIGAILKKIGFEDVDMVAVEEERVALAKMEEEENKKSLQAQRKRLMRRESSGGKEDEGAEAEEEAEEIEKQVQAQTQKSMLTKAVEYFYTPSVPAPEDANAVKKDVKPSLGNSPPTTTGSTTATGHNTQSLAQRAYSALPSMPSISGPSPEQSSRKVAQGQKQPRRDDTSSRETQSYASQVTGYLPSMPKNLPSMPSLFGGNKDHQDASKPTQAARSAGNVSQQTAKRLANSTDQVPSPTSRNTTNLKDDPATKDTNNAIPKTSNAQQKESAATTQKTKEPSSVAGTTVQNTSQTGLSTKKKTTDEIEGVRKNLPAQPSSDDKQRESKQSYVSYAASYLPSMPKSIPSMPGLSSGRKPPPKLERRDSPRIEPSRPPLKQRGSSQVKPPPSKLEERRSGLRSPPPKLGSRSKSGGVESSS